MPEIWVGMYGMGPRRRWVTGVRRGSGVCQDAEAAALLVSFARTTSRTNELHGAAGHTRSLFNLVQQPPQPVPHLAPALARLARDLDQASPMRLAQRVAICRLHLQQCARIRLAGDHHHRQTLLCYSSLKRQLAAPPPHARKAHRDRGQNSSGLSPSSRHNKAPRPTARSARLARMSGR